MPLAHDYYTADMVRAMPNDGKRYEVVWGELLVTPAPRWNHQRIAGRLFRWLADACDEIGGLEALYAPADVTWSDDTLVQPDVFVVPTGLTTEKDPPEAPRLRLVVEVLSESTSRRDRFTKRVLYQRQGIETIWLLDPERRVVEVWTPGATLPVVETERLSWQPAGVARPFVIELTRLFAP